MAKNTHCKTCGWARKCDQCVSLKASGSEFAERLSIDSLTFVPYRNWRALPESPGIYFAINSDRQVVYIGQTQDLLNRWVQNYRALYYCGVTQIGFVLTTDNGLWRLAAERTLIERFRPTMHGVRKVMGPKIKHLGLAIERQGRNGTRRF